MDFINRGFSSLLIIALMFIIISAILNILPVILAAGAVVWAVSYVIKAFKKWNSIKSKVFKGGAAKAEKVETMKADFSESFDTKNAIDVEYTEVK